MLSPGADDTQSLAINPQLSDYVGANAAPEDDWRGPSRDNVPPVPPAEAKESSIPPPGMDTPPDPPKGPPGMEPAPASPPQLYPPADLAPDDPVLADAVTQGAPNAPGSITDHPQADVPEEEDLDTQREKALAQVQKYGTPNELKSNWAQRLGMALLASTKLGPIANMVVHPKWMEQEYNRKQNLAAAEGQLKNIETAANADALNEQREATAEQKRLLGANYADQRAAQNKKTQEDEEKADLSRKQRAFDALTDKRSILYRPATEPAPQGWEKIPIANPSLDPSMVAYAPSAIATVPNELLKFLPGYEAGQQIDRPTLEKATKAYQDETVALAKIDAKPDPAAKENEAMWTADSVNPDPAISGPAKAKLAEALKQKLAGRPVIQNTFPGLNGPQNPATAQLTGEDYLKTLPLATSNTIRAISEGRQAPPLANSRSQAAQQLLAALNQYDPEFTTQRAQVRKAFTTDKNIRNNNIAAVHLDALGEIAKAMDNGTFQPGNELWNRATTIFGGAPPTNYEGLRQAVAGEMDSALHGTSTIPGREAIAATMPAKAAPGQMAGIVDTNLRTLAQKLNAYHEQYAQQIPNDTVWSPILPSARSVFQKHKINLGGETNQSNSLTVSYKGHDYGPFKTQSDADKFKKDVGLVK